MIGTNKKVILLFKRILYVHHLMYFKKNQAKS